MASTRQKPTSDALPLPKPPTLNPFSDYPLFRAYPRGMSSRKRPFNGGGSPSYDRRRTQK